MDDSDMEVNDDSNVVDHSYTYDELVDILKGMTIFVEKLETKITNLEHENLTLKNSHKHTEHLLNTFVCKHEPLKLAHEVLCQKHEELKKDHDFLTMSISKEEIKIDESSSCELDGQLQYVANSCVVGHKNVSISCDDLDLPCTSYLDTCSSSMYHETNHVEENNEPKNEKVKSSGKVGLCALPYVTHSQLLESHKKYGNMNGIAYNNTKIKGKRWGKKKYEKEMKRLEDEKISHYLCFKCHTVGHLAMICPSKKRKRPHDSSEDESKNSQIQANVNRKVDNKLGKKRVRRGGKKKFEQRSLL
jgi:hypothetical protein